MTEPRRIELSRGNLRFSALELGDGPVVLCLHGFPDHWHSFASQLPAFAEAGFRAVAPMLRGYESFSQPGRRVADYHPLELAHDVLAWADELAGDAPVHVVGHDWGAILTYIVCHLAPERIRSAAALAVPDTKALRVGWPRYRNQLRNSWYTIFFQLRGIADLALRARDFALVERLWRDWSPGWTPQPQEMAALKATFRAPGVVGSALAYYRAFLNPLSSQTRRMVELVAQPCRVPMLALTGANDGCMDTRFFDHMSADDYPAGLRVERVEGAGHFLHQERAEVVTPILLAWLEQHRDERDAGREAAGDGSTSTAPRPSPQRCA